MDRRTGLACPLAFGEIGVKERIKSVLHYKKPAFWAIAAAAVVCVAAAVCFLTDPVKEEEGSGGAALAGADSGSGADSGADGTIDVGGAAGGNGAANDGNGTGIGGTGGDGNGTGGLGGDGSGADGSGQGSAEAAAQAAQREELVRKWAEAFVSRDGNAIESLASPSLAGELLSGPAGQRSFGESSPWPRETGRDIYIRDIGEQNAQIQYYAWTSDSHVAA